MTDKTHLLVVAFYYPPADDPLLNRVTAAVDAPYCHVELAFPPHSGPCGKGSSASGSKGMFDTRLDAVCVMFDEKVEFVSKQYSRQNYKLLYVPVTAQQLNRMRSRALEIQRSGAAFSRYAMLSTFLRFLPTGRGAQDPDATCCSILASQLLIHGGVLPDSVNPRRVTPSKLQRLVMEHTRTNSLCFGAPLVKLQQIRVQPAKDLARLRGASLGTVVAKR
jgi:hypothetical protein